jgi:autotransporter-associated beta strand protein
VSSDYFTPGNWNENEVPSVASGQVNVGNIASTNNLNFAGDNSSSQSPLFQFGGNNSDGKTFTMSSGTFVNGGMNMGTSASLVTFNMNGGVIVSNQTGGGGNFHTSRSTDANVNFNMSGGLIDVTGNSTGNEIVFGQGGNTVSATTSIVMSGGTIQSNGRVVFGISPSNVASRRSSRAQVTMTGGLMWATGSRDTTNDDRGTLQFAAGGIDFQGGTLRGTDISFRDGFNIGADNFQGQGDISGVNFRGGVLEVITNRTEGSVYVIPQGVDPSTVIGIPAQRGMSRSLSSVDFRVYTSSTDSAVRVLMTTATNGKMQSNTFASIKGDYNLDGVVNFADYQYWSTQQGNTYCGDPLDVPGSLLVYYGADGNGDGMATQADADVWNAQYRQRTSGGPYANAQPISIAVSSGTQTQTTAGYSNLSFTTASSVTKTGGGTLVLDQANSTTGTITIQGGGVQLSGTVNAAAAATIRPEAGGTLTLDPYLQTSIDGLKPLAGGVTNVGTGMVTVAAGGLSVADMVTALTAGRNGGSWDGTTGITSSEAAASGGTRAVGWLENVNAVANLSSVTFAFAAPGDTNLDWQVDVTDAANLVAFGKYDTAQPATWLEGDFNYDGIVDVTDAAEFINTGLYDTGFYNPPAAQGAVAAVPEPSSVGVVVGMASLLLGWRLRRRTA